MSTFDHAPASWCCAVGVEGDHFLEFVLGVLLGFFERLVEGLWCFGLVEGFVSVVEFHCLLSMTKFLDEFAFLPWRTGLLGFSALSCPVLRSVFFT